MPRLKGKVRAEANAQAKRDKKETDEAATDAKQEKRSENGVTKPAGKRKSNEESYHTQSSYMHSAAEEITRATLIEFIERSARNMKLAYPPT